MAVRSSFKATVGKFSPLHGLEHIIKAAEELEVHPDIQFQIIGSGQLSGEIASWMKAWEVSNVSFLSWVRYEELNDHIAEADVCLGIFGKSEKARRVIPNKVFMALAMRKPVITEDSLAMQEAGFIDGENIILCEGANPAAIANSVLRLKQETELREQIARNGYKLFKEKFSSQRIEEGVKAILKELIEG